MARNSNNEPDYQSSTNLIARDLHGVRTCIPQIAMRCKSQLCSVAGKNMLLIFLENISICLEAENWIIL